MVFQMTPIENLQLNLKKLTDLSKKGITAILNHCSCLKKTRMNFFGYFIFDLILLLTMISLKIMLRANVCALIYFLIQEVS